MKKSFILLMTLCLMMTLCLSSFLFVGCTNTTSPTVEPLSQDNLVVYFVPSKKLKEISTVAAPLGPLLQEALLQEGYAFKNIDIQVGTSYEAVGEALSNGTAHVGFIPGGTYVLYDDSTKVILTATRNGLTKDFSSPKDWNDSSPTFNTQEKVTYYRSLILAGPSEKGRLLASKVNTGEPLTVDDLKNANWGVRSTSSPAGYIYPALWLNKKFGLNMADLPHVIQTDSYDSSMAHLASEQLDVIVTFADARMDYEEEWTSKYGRKNSIWAETNLIGVTEGIYNDTITVTKKDKMMDKNLIKALQNAFTSIANTPEGREIISIYQHNGYKLAKDSDYDKERSAQKFIHSIH